LIRKATLEDVPLLVPLFEAYRAFYRQDPIPPCSPPLLTSDGNKARSASSCPPK
jgi:hypothetical protein